MTTQSGPSFLNFPPAVGEPRVRTWVVPYGYGGTNGVHHFCTECSMTTVGPGHWRNSAHMGTDCPVWSRIQKEYDLVGAIIHLYPGLLTAMSEGAGTNEEDFSGAECRGCGYGAGPSGICQSCEDAADAAKWRHLGLHALHDLRAIGVPIERILGMTPEVLAEVERYDREMLSYS